MNRETEKLKSTLAIIGAALFVSLILTNCIGKKDKSEEPKTLTKKDSVNVISVNKIIAGSNISSFLGDTIIKIIQNADSVSCNIITTKSDSSGGKENAYTYDVPSYFGRLSIALQSILKFIALSDETYIEDKVVVKLQFKPTLTFAFNFKNQSVLLLYSPASCSFGFGYKGGLLKKHYKKTDNINNFFLEIEKYANNHIK